MRSRNSFCSTIRSGSGAEASWIVSINDTLSPLESGALHSSSSATSADFVQRIVQIGARELMTLCLAESERRFSGYDRRLLRPKTMPNLVRFALRFMRADNSE